MKSCAFVSLPEYRVEVMMGRSQKLCSLLPFLALLSGAWAQSNPPLIEPSIFELLDSELSGEQAKNHVQAIARYDRVQASRGYSQAAEYVLESLRSFGYTFEESWIESFPSDGRIHYQTWQSPSGWVIDSAELRLVEPRNEVLARYPQHTMSLMTYSNPGSVRAELVDVGEGTSDADYEGLEVSGKLVLATGYGGDVHRLAVLKYGAAAVLSYLDDSRGSANPEMIRYTGMWPRSGELDRVTFGFNLSHRQGVRLKRMLEQGQRVVLDARVTGVGLEPWRMDVVVAHIRGTTQPSQELVLTAHLDHPRLSANDNASGSAALLDIARTLRKLIREGRLIAPKRTIRFLWVPEFFGTMAYLDRHPELKGPELGGSILGALNLDMVGEDTELLDSRLNLTWTPQSIGSILPDVASEMLSYLDSVETARSTSPGSKLNYRVTPFGGGSDHVVFNDGAVQVPALMLGHWPDYTHHTSQDTLDKVDPVELKRCELIAASTIWYLASLTEKQSIDVTNLVAARAQSRLVNDTRRAISWVLEAPPAKMESTYRDAREVVDFALSRELKSLDDVRHYAPFNMTDRLVETWSLGLEGQAELQRRTLLAVYYQKSGRYPQTRTQNEKERSASSWIPTRRTRGPLAADLPELRLPEEERAWYETPEARRLDRYLLINLIDGNRTILQVRDHLTAATQPHSLEVVDRFIRDLARVGLVELRRTDP